MSFSIKGKTFITVLRDFVNKEAVRVKEMLERGQEAKGQPTRGINCIFPFFVFHDTQPVINGYSRQHWSLSTSTALPQYSPPV